MAEQPRGIRNANPGNIRLSQAKWKGEVFPGTDKSFCQFSTMAYGVRASAMVFLDYYHTHGLRTVAQYINRWAPTSENNTSAYVKNVASEMGVNPDATCDLTALANLEKLVTAVFRQENGGSFVASANIETGCALALDTYL